MHDSDWEVAAHIVRYKKNLMGSSRTIEIEILRVRGIHLLPGGIRWEGDPQAHVDRQPTILHREYGDWIVTGKWWDIVMTCIRSYFGVSNFCPSILDMFAVVRRISEGVQPYVQKLVENKFLYTKKRRPTYHIAVQHPYVCCIRPNLRRVISYTFGYLTDW